MHIAYYKEYSYNLNRDMEFKVYGHAGKPMLVFPAQDGRFFDYENFKMVETIADHLEQGKVQLFCVDTLDQESFTAKGDQGWRIGQYEDYIRYICDEFYPRMRQISRETSGVERQDKVVTTGCSMGASHAMNFFCRRPDLFDGTLSMSGIYGASFSFENYQDSRVYDNSPLDFLPNLPHDHYYRDMYRNSKIYVVIGQGRWEDECLADTRNLDRIFKDLGIHNAIFDYWGHDVDHDWPWWRIQLRHVIDYFKD